MKNLSLLIVCSCLIALVSCSKTENPEKPAYPEIEIDFSGEEIDLNDVKNIGLYIVKSGDNLIDKPVINNQRIELQGDSFKISSSENLDQNNSYDLYLYSPHSIDKLENNKHYNYVIKADQSHIDNIINNDFLYSKLTSVSLGTPQLKASFNHLMSQVDVVIDIARSYESAGLSVELRDFISNVDIDMMTGDQENQSGASNIKPYVDNLVVNKGTISGIKAIVIPQKKLRGEPICYISTNDFSKDIVLDDDIEFIQGKKTLIHIQVGATISINASIVEWDDSFIDLEINKPISELYDIEGNKYEVITIDDLYWTASNLKTTKLNDGTQIKEGRKDIEWFYDDYDKGEARYCFFKNNPDNKTTRGALYNWLTVKTGKICPKGWSVPSQEQWLKMRDFLGGEYAAGNELKSTSGWEDLDGVSRPEYQGTNSVGFNAIPASYRGHLGTFDHGGYNPNGITGWWSSTYQGSRMRGYAYYIVYGAGNLVEENATLDFGYSIRCVRSIK